MVAPQRVTALGYGAYTVPQAAKLARVNARLVNYWFDDDSARGPVIRRFMPQNEDGLVGFVDLIQLLAVHTIRLKHRISLQKIREAVKAAEEMGIKFPFARSATRAFLLDDQIILQTGEDLIGATGKHKKAYVMSPIVLPYLVELTFDRTGLPSEYRPLANILLSPKRQWGARTVDTSTCHYTVQTLVSAVESEGSIEGAADACGVTTDDVRFALKYEDYLAGLAA